MFSFARSAGYPGYAYYSYYGYGWGGYYRPWWPSLFWRVAEALVGRRTRQAWPRMARASLTRSLGQDALLFWNCASLGRSLFRNFSVFAHSTATTQPFSVFKWIEGICAGLCSCIEAQVETGTGRGGLALR